MNCWQPKRLLLNLGSPLLNMIRLLPITGKHLQNPQRLLHLPQNPRLQLSRVQQRKHQVPHSLCPLPPLCRVLKMKGRQPKRLLLNLSSLLVPSASKTLETTSKTKGTEAADKAKPKAKARSLLRKTSSKRPPKPTSSTFGLN